MVYASWQLLINNMQVRTSPFALGVGVRVCVGRAYEFKTEAAVSLSLTAVCMAWIKTNCCFCLGPCTAGAVALPDIPVCASATAAVATAGGIDSNARSWLKSKEPGSYRYVLFGSMQ
jgi:hypothetical protein